MASHNRKSGNEPKKIHADDWTTVHKILVLLVPASNLRQFCNVNKYRSKKFGIVSVFCFLQGVARVRHPQNFAVERVRCRV